MSVPPPLWPPSALRQSVVNMWARQFPLILPCLLCCQVSENKTTDLFSLNDIHSHRVIYCDSTSHSLQINIFICDWPLFFELHVCIVWSPRFVTLFFFQDVIRKFHSSLHLPIVSTFYTSALQTQVLGVVLQSRLYFVPHAETVKITPFPTSIRSDYTSDS